MSTRLLRSLAGLGVLLPTLAFGAQKARAELLIFNSKEDFLAATAGAPLQFQGFESFTPGPSVPFPGFILTNASPRSPMLRVFSPFSGDGLSSISGNLDQGTKFVFDFDEPLSAFGIFFFNKSSALVRFRDDLGDEAVLPTPGIFQPITYFGVINSDAPFRQVSFTVESGGLGNFYAFDELSFGRVTAIPEPSGALLLGVVGLAIVGYGWSRRLRGQRENQ
jgi:hypothetical protein